VKRTILLLGLVLVSALVGCDGGGLFNPADAINPYGYIFKNFTTATAPTLPTDVRSIVYDASKLTLFIGGKGTGLFSVNPNSDPPTAINQATATAELGARIVQCLAVDKKTGDLFIGTNLGLFRCNKTTGVTTPVAAIAANSSVLSIAQPDNDTLWVGLFDDSADTNSIARSVDSGANFTLFGTDDGMTASAVVQIHADANVTLAAGTGSAGKAGLFKFNKQMLKFAPIDNAPFENGATLINVFGTSWYAGGVNKGLHVSTDSGTTWVELLSSTSSITPYQILNESDRYWVSSNKGLYLTYNLKDFNLFNTASRLGKDLSRQLASASSMIWMTHTDPTVADGTDGITRGVFAGD